MDFLPPGIDPLVWLGGGAILSVIAGTVAVVALSRRLDRLGEDLKGLRKLGISLPPIDTEQTNLTTHLASAAGPLPQPSELKLHLSQIKRQQLVLMDRIGRISSALSELRAVPSSLEEIKDEQARVLEALVTISAELEDWIARFDDTSSELTHLLESEPVVEFQNSLDPK
jgi:DNA repair ATPase RecN